MAIDPNAPSRPETSSRASAIENELPTYRAISATAVVSLVLGLVSLLSFVDPWFLLAGAGAIVAGVLALLKIGRYSDVLTGAKYAQAGIVLGLVFGLSSTTTRQVDLFLLARKADAFADKYVQVLQTEGLAESVWYRLAPIEQTGKTPKQYLATVKTSGRDGQAEYMTRVAPVEQLRARINQGAKLHRVGVEECGYDGVTPYAGVLLELDGPGHPDQPEATDHVLIELRGEKEGRQITWYVSEVRNNYKPKSFTLKKQAVDDGHGHSHAH